MLIYNKLFWNSSLF